MIITAILPITILFSAHTHYCYYLLYYIIKLLWDVTLGATLHVHHVWFNLDRKKLCSACMGHSKVSPCLFFF